MLYIGILIIAFCLIYIYHNFDEKIIYIYQIDDKDLRIIRKFIIFQILPNQKYEKIRHMLSYRNVIQVKSKYSSKWCDVSWASYQE